MACNSGLCLGTKWVKASECNMLGPWLSRGRLLRQGPLHPQPSNPGRLEPSASLMEGFSAPQKLHSLVPSDAHFHPEAAAFLFSRHPIPRKERVPEPCLSEALGKGAVSTEHCFPNKTILIKPKVPSYKSFGFAPLLCSLAATTQSFVSRCGSPISFFSLLQHMQLQPSFCSYKSVWQTDWAFLLPMAEKFSSLFVLPILPMAQIPILASCKGAARRSCGDRRGRRS